MTLNERNAPSYGFSFSALALEVHEDRPSERQKMAGPGLQISAMYTVPLQCLWRDSVTLISTFLLTYLHLFSDRQQRLKSNMNKFMCRVGRLSLTSKLH